MRGKILSMILLLPVTACSLEVNVNVNRDEAPQATEATVEVRPTSETPTRRISVTWNDAPLNRVLVAFSAFSGKAISTANKVAILAPAHLAEARVTVAIDDQPWDVALNTILRAHGLVTTELPNGTIWLDRN